MNVRIEITIDDETAEDLLNYYVKMRSFETNSENRNVLNFMRKVLNKISLAKSEDRNKLICKMRDEGSTFSEIAKTFGISPTRVSVIYRSQEVKDGLEKELMNDDAFSCLLTASVETTRKEIMGIRAYNALSRAGLKLQDIQKYSDGELMNIRNVGVTTVAILRNGYEIYNKRNMQNA